ncbi:MAG: hypothetical protein ACR2JM_00520, partial [Mycobacterium sp.]
MNTLFVTLQGTNDGQWTPDNYEPPPAWPNFISGPASLLADIGLNFANSNWGVSIPDLLKYQLTGPCAGTCAADASNPYFVSALGTFLSNSDVRAAISGNLPGLIGGGLNGLAQSIGESFGDALEAALAGNPVTAGVATALGTSTGSLVGALLGNAQFSNQLATLGVAAFTDLLTQTGVGDVLAGVAFNAIRPAFGLDPVDVPSVASVANGVGATVTGVVQSLLGNPSYSAVLTGLIGLVSDLASGAAADPAVQSLVGQQVTGMVTAALGNLPGSAGIANAVSTAVQNLLGDSAAVSGALAVVTSGLTSFFGAQGVPSALAGAAGQLSSAVLSGTD